MHEQTKIQNCRKCSFQLKLNLILCTDIVCFFLNIQSAPYHIRFSPNLTLKMMQILLAIYNFYKWFNLLKYTVPKSKCRAFYNPIWFKTPPCTKSYFILFQCTYNDSIILVHILYSLYISYVPCKYHIFLVHILYSLYISYIPCTYPIFLVRILYSLYISYIPCTYPIFLVHIPRPSYPRVLDRSECYDYDLECLGNIGRDFGLPIPHPYQGPVAAPYQYPGPSPYAGSPFGGGGLGKYETLSDRPSLPATLFYLLLFTRAHAHPFYNYLSI